jgi:hypothetical protein
MSQQQITILVPIFFLALQACSPVKVQRVYDDSEPQVTITNESNYVIGEPRSASIGGSIIEKIHSRQQIQAGVLARPNKDVDIRLSTCLGLLGSCGSFLLADRDYEVLKRVNYQNQIFYVVDASRSQASRIDPTIYSRSGPFYLVSLEGVPLDRLFAPGPDSVFPNKLSIEPSDVKFSINDRITTLPQGYINESVIFAGSTDDQIAVKYISKSIDDSGQIIERHEEYNLPNKKEIRFRNYRINVLSADEDFIEYVVISDGHQN